MPYFQHWGDEPRPRFFQVSKLSEDQTKKVFTKTGEQLFFPEFKRKQKKTAPDIIQRSDADQSQVIGGDADVDHSQTIRGDAVKLLGGYIPHPPGFRHPWLGDGLLRLNLIYDATVRLQLCAI